jgi:hypothetical protein
VPAPDARGKGRENSSEKGRKALDREWADVVMFANPLFQAEGDAPAGRVIFGINREGGCFVLMDGTEKKGGGAPRGVSPSQQFIICS